MSFLIRKICNLIIRLRPNSLNFALVRTGNVFKYTPSIIQKNLLIQGIIINRYVVENLGWDSFCYIILSVNHDGTSRKISLFPTERKEIVSEIFKDPVNVIESIRPDQWI
jgi:hypothetical protein